MNPSSVPPRRSRLRAAVGIPLLVLLGVLWMLLYTAEFLTGCFIGEPVRTLDHWLEAIGQWMNSPATDHDKPR